MTPIGFATEREHLKEQSEKDKDALKQQAIEMRANGMSVKEISVALGVPDKTLYRWFKESKE